MSRSIVRFRGCALALCRVTPAGRGAQVISGRGAWDDGGNMEFLPALDGKEVKDMSNQNPEAFKQRIETLLSSWEEHAPNAKFFSLTLGELKLQMNSSLKSREEIADCEAKAKAAIVQRDNADIENRETIYNVVNAIRGDANYGENSPLYAALGYVPRNQRASGLSRSKAEEAAAVKKAA